MEKRSSNNLTAIFTDTANAIRAKTSSSDLICPLDFATEIEAIPTGGDDNYTNDLLELGFVSGEISASAKRIGSSIFFHYNPLITAATFPECLRIDGYAFYSCTSLRDIYMFDNVYCDFSAAFNQCNNIRSMYLLYSYPLCFSGFSAYNLSNKVLYVPQSLVNTYAN